MLELIYIIEILTIIKCIHCIYNKEIKMNGALAATFLALFVTVNLQSVFPEIKACSILVCAILSLYCVKMFQSTFKETVINISLYMIVTTSIQFLCCVPMLYVIRNNRYLSTLCADVLALLFTLAILPRIKIYKLAKWALKKNLLFYVALGYIFAFIAIMIIQIKVVGGVEMETVVFLVPLVVITILICRQWAKYQTYYVQKEKELEVYIKDKQSFTGLIMKIRLRNHEVRNHIMSILAMHYNVKTYDELVKMQREYCGYIIQHKEYDMLLSLYNSAICGFLYEKFNYIESKGIAIDCKIPVKNYASHIVEHVLVEMLGILLDNATEAVENIENKNITFEIIETSMGYEYIVRNPYRFVTNEEILKWFDYENSSKGEGRGIGLYHLKCLCVEWDCAISCSCIEIDNVYWMEFRIGTSRKG